MSWRLLPLPGPRLLARRRPEPANLVGKEELTEVEAAHYCCVSVAKLRRYGPPAGLVAVMRSGRQWYRRADLQRVLEGLWSAPMVRT